MIRRAVEDSRLGRFLEESGTALSLSAAVAAVAEGGVVRWASTGRMADGDDRSPDLASRFDLASLTKPVMATLALALDRADVLSLEERIGALAPAAHPRLARRHLASLLRHRAGMTPWAPLMVRTANCDEAAAWLSRGGAAGELVGAPPATYSDLGYMLWGLLAERATGQRLGTLVERHVASPLGLALRSSPGALPDVVACGLDNGVEVRLAAAAGISLAAERVDRRGVVQDGNARFLGGLAGHAGLFGSVDDLLRLADAWLGRRPRFLTSRSIERALAGSGSFALGWARRRVAGSAGRSLPPDAFGHTGFTGTSLWIDPSVQRVLVLLAHRNRSDSDMNAFRRRFHAEATSGQSVERFAAARARHQKPRHL